MIRLVRYATVRDHRACGEVPIRASDYIRIQDGCRFVFRYCGDGTSDNPFDDGQDRIADVAFLRADGGWAEIQDAIQKLGI